MSGEEESGVEPRDQSAFLPWYEAVEKAAEKHLGHGIRRTELLYDWQRDGHEAVKYNHNHTHEAPTGIDRQACATSPTLLFVQTDNGSQWAFYASEAWDWPESVTRRARKDPKAAVFSCQRGPGAAEPADEEIITVAAKKGVDILGNCNKMAFGVLGMFYIYLCGYQCRVARGSQYFAFGSNAATARKGWLLGADSDKAPCCRFEVADLQLWRVEGQS